MKILNVVKKYATATNVELVIKLIELIILIMYR